MVHHGEALRVESRDDHLVYHLERDWRQADLNEADKAMLGFAGKLNSRPGKISAGDTDTLHSQGFDDRAILDIVMITALFNFMNRIVDGVGVVPQEPFLRNKARGDTRVEERI